MKLCIQLSTLAGGNLGNHSSSYVHICKILVFLTILRCNRVVFLLARFDSDVGNLEGTLVR